jgi:hypothetical protein
VILGAVLELGDTLDTVLELGAALGITLELGDVLRSLLSAALEHDDALNAILVAAHQYFSRPWRCASFSTWCNNQCCARRCTRCNIGFLH